MKYCIHTSKLGLWVNVLVNFFVVNDIDIHQLNLGPFENFKFVIENSLQIIFFFIFSIMKEKIIYVFKKKPVPNEK
jgi:hypothetical protein